LDFVYAEVVEDESAEAWVVVAELAGRRIEGEGQEPLTVSAGACHDEAEDENQHL
jgi:hypothetical protein